jgi:DNA-binding transcriptional LysR family regulator
MSVAENLSVTKAANALHIAQPTVSTQLSRLSDSLKLQLFEQVGKQLYLTEMGKEVLNSTRELFAVMDNLEMRLAKHEGLSLGQLKISVVTTAKYLIPSFLGDFCQLYPNIEPEFHIGNRADIIARLQQNKDDVYVFSNPPKELDIESHYITENPLVVIAKQDHPLAQVKQIDWQQLNGERIIMRETGSGTRYAVERFFAKHQLEISRPITIASNEAIKESVMAGLGISIVSRHALHHMAAGNLTELDVKLFPIANTWYWVRPKGKHSSPIVETFKQYVQKQMSAFIEKNELS